MMSPGIQHTPLARAPSSKESEIMELKQLVREEISKIINLRQLYIVIMAFLENKNIRTTFPFYLSDAEVLALYGKESFLANLFPHLVPTDLFPKDQNKVSIHHCIFIVVDSLKKLTSNSLK